MEDFRSALDSQNPMTNKFVAMTYGFLSRFMGIALGSLLLLLFIFCLFVLVQIDLFSFVLGEFNACLKKREEMKPRL